VLKAKVEKVRSDWDAKAVKDYGPEVFAKAKDGFELRDKLIR
jgi:hypothetical protein